MPRVTSAHPPSTASTQPDPSLPPLCWRHIIKGLDPYSFQQLRLASRLFCSLCKAMSDSTLTQLSLDNLKSVDTADLAGGVSCGCCPVGAFTAFPCNSPAHRPASKHAPTPPRPWTPHQQTDLSPVCFPFLHKLPRALQRPACVYWHLKPAPPPWTPQKQTDPSAACLFCTCSQGPCCVLPVYHPTSKARCPQQTQPPPAL